MVRVVRHISLNHRCCVAGRYHWKHFIQFLTSGPQPVQGQVSQGFVQMNLEKLQGDFP